MRWLQILAGILLIILGLAGLILPGLQGVALLVAGLLLLAHAIPAVGRWLQRFEARHPWAAKFLARFRSKNGKLDLTPLIVAIVIGSAVWAAIAYGSYLLFF
jgi:uncharacterized membrane protein YbaN (DUF454 family)